MLLFCKIVNSQNAYPPENLLGCDQDALATCDLNYQIGLGYNEYQCSVNIHDCLTDATKSLLGGYGDDLGKESMANFLFGYYGYGGDSFSSILGLLGLPEYVNINDDVTNCLANTQDAYWNNFDYCVNTWHSCEEDPNRGNCPNRHN